MCERQILPQITSAIVGRKYTCACTKPNTWDRMCYEPGKGENITSTQEVSGTVYQRSPWAMTEWREQHKGACGKAVCMDRKQLGIPQKHEKVSKDFGGKEAPNLDLYFLVVWPLASCTTSLSCSFVLFIFYFLNFLNYFIDVLISTIQQNDSVVHIYIHTHTFFFIFFFHYSFFFFSFLNIEFFCFCFFNINLFILIGG